MTTNINNMTIAKPKHITSLATSGILIHVEIRSWSANEHDEDISQEVTHAKKADSKAGWFTKNLMTNVPEHKALLKDRSDWYNWIKKATYEWAGSWRYLPNLRIPKVMEEFKERYAVTEKLVSDFLAVYQNRVNDMAFTLGATFKASDYPSVDQIKSKYSVRLNTANVPEGDFRNTISQDLADDLHNHYMQQTEQFKNVIVGEQMKQFVDVMQAIAKSCDVRTVTEADGSTKTKRGKIYESTIEKALEYCETFKQFNLDADPKLEQARADLQNILMNVNVDALRESDGQRTIVKESIGDILSRLGMDQEVI